MWKGGRLFRLIIVVAPVITVVALWFSFNPFSGLGAIDICSVGRGTGRSVGVAEWKQHRESGVSA